MRSDGKSRFDGPFASSPVMTCISSRRPATCGGISTLTLKLLERLTGVPAHLAIDGARREASTVEHDLNGQRVHGCGRGCRLRDEAGGQRKDQQHSDSCGGAFGGPALAAAAAFARISGGSIAIDFQHAERTFGEHFPHERHRDVVDRNIRSRTPFGLSVVRVSVENRGDRVPRQRLFEAAAPEVRKDLGGSPSTVA